jgi:hypothetical protein
VCVGWRGGECDVVVVLGIFFFPLSLCTHGQHTSPAATANEQISERGLREVVIESVYWGCGCSPYLIPTFSFLLYGVWRISSNGSRKKAKANYTKKKRKKVESTRDGAETSPQNKKIKLKRKQNQRKHVPCVKKKRRATPLLE